jgi:hypothetical protein
MKTYHLVLMAIFAVLIFGSVIAFNVSIWKECRADHSWSYCFRLVSR